MKPGEMIGPYEILSALGKGGMGEVFRARDTRLEREVAVKILAGSLSEDSAAISRFVREAKALAALSHSNIIAIHDFGTDQGVSYAVMELLKGQTLRERLAGSKLDEKEAIEIGSEIVDGLCAAHSAGVIHRDLKPENIFITNDGAVKILDFGLARREVSTTREQTSAVTISQSEVGTVMGTVPYMSPEQVRGEKVDTRTDIFSFGAVLYEMLSGERLFARKTSADSISAVLNERPPELRTSSEINQIIQHCLEKNADQRFQTARDLLFALKSAATGAQIVHRKSSEFALHKRIAAILIMLLIVLAIAGSYFLWTSRDNAIESLAIMPFVNGSGNADAEYLSDGITDSIIYSLSNLPKLRIMGRDTVFTYKGKQIDPRKIGRELNVQAVVTGTVVQQGETLVVRANLINVADGTQLWGDQYNRTFADILKIQSQISQQISEKLQLKLSGEQKKLLTKKITDNPEVYRLWLKGNYHIWKGTEEDYEMSRQYFQKALDLDPASALANSGIGGFYQAGGLQGILPPEEAWPKAEAAFQAALRLDPQFSEVNVGLGMLQYMYKWNWQQGEQYYGRANGARGTGEIGHALCLLAVGNFDEAVRIGKSATEKDPLSRFISVNYGQILASAGMYGEAIDQLKKTIRLDPNFDAPHFSLAQIYENKGMIREAIAETVQAYHLQGNEDAADLFRDAKDAISYQEAKDAIARYNLESFTELAKQKYVSALEFARLHAQLNEKDKAFEWLEKAFKERSSQLIYIRVLDDFKNLRSDPRFDDLVKRIGLPS